jgi:hypothetical protein
MDSYLETRRLWRDLDIWLAGVPNKSYQSPNPAFVFGVQDGQLVCPVLFQPEVTITYLENSYPDQPESLLRGIHQTFLLLICIIIIFRSTTKILRPFNHVVRRMRLEWLLRSRTLYYTSQKEAVYQYYQDLSEFDVSELSNILDVIREWSAPDHRDDAVKVLKDILRPSFSKFPVGTVYHVEPETENEAIFRVVSNSLHMEHARARYHAILNVLLLLVHCYAILTEVAAKWNSPLKRRTRIPESLLWLILNYSITRIEQKFGQRRRLEVLDSSFTNFRRNEQKSHNYPSHKGSNVGVRDQYTFVDLKGDVMLLIPIAIPLSLTAFWVPLKYDWFSIGVLHQRWISSALHITFVSIVWGLRTISTTFFANRESQTVSGRRKHRSLILLIVFVDIFALCWCFMATLVSMSTPCNCSIFGNSYLCISQKRLFMFTPRMVAMRLGNAEDYVFGLDLLILFICLIIIGFTLYHFIVKPTRAALSYTFDARHNLLGYISYFFISCLDSLKNSIQSFVPIPIIWWPLSDPGTSKTRLNRKSRVARSCVRFISLCVNHTEF